MAVDKGYKDRLIELRKQLAESTRLGLVNPELFQQQLVQMLNGVESIKIKSQSEIERLTNLIGEERGRIKACNDMGDLIVNIVAAFVAQENNRLQEDNRLQAERAEREALMNASKVEEEPTTQLVVTDPLSAVPEVTIGNFEVAKSKLPPGVNFIKTKKTK